ncbi:hypothetical protein QW131_00090 [Roseibium salinum]|nr:hypothetical protein [Roseibium salinum]
MPAFSDSDEALAYLRQNHGVAVIFFLLQSAGLRRGGIFFRVAETILPQAARVMLTREKSIEAVKRALNEGHAFLFLEKNPASPMISPLQWKRR